MSSGNWLQVLRKDGWQNILTGLGIKGRDKRVSSVPTPMIFSQQELEDLYRADDIAQKVVDRIPKEMFRAGYDVKVKGNDLGKEIEDYLNRIGADEKMRKATKLARLHGGAAVVLGIDDGRDSREPVNMAGIRSVKWIQVLDRWQLQWREIQSDLSKPDYGLPTLYSIQAVSAEAAQSNQEVHSSRIIRFDGIELPDRAFVQNNYWHDSVLSAVFSPLQLFNTGFDSGGAMLADFNQTVYKMQNLADLLASGDDQLVQKRLQLIDASRSVVRAIVIQEGESFERTSSNLTGAPDMLRMIANRLVAATNMPHTLILGEGSQGNTSGRSEETDFLNMVAQEQETYLKPRQMRLIELILAAADGPKAKLQDVEIVYRPLWEMDENEKAANYKTRAEGDSLYLQNGVVDPDEVAKSRFSSPESEIQVDLEAREALATPTIPPAAEPPAIPAPKTDASTTVQSLILAKETFASADKAAAWIAAHNFQNHGIDETGESFRFRQRPPEDFQEGTLKTIEMRPGVSAVIGVPKDSLEDEDDGLDLMDAAPAGVDTVPPKAAQENARLALEYRRKHGRGMTAVGVARARDLSNAASLSRETIARMAAFERHRQNYRPGESEPDNGPTAGTIAWLGWGGNEGVEWAQRKLREIDG